MQMKIAVLAGDGIGPEIVAQAVKVLRALASDGLKIELEEAPFGGAGFDRYGDPLPESTLKLARAADAVLCGAVGGPKYDALPRPQRPEQGILRIRKELGLFANLRPAVLYPELVGASSLKPEVVSGLDIMIIRERTGDIYFGEPRGRRDNARGDREGYDTMLYSEPEIRRIAEIGFGAARKRGKKLCSVDKENVLETSRFWREIVNDVARKYPEIALSHMYVDNAAMQLVRNPKQFDVVVTGNMFGDILSDEASMLTGSIGMLPSASLDERGKGLYEPIHGSAPDIAGQNIANPLATILSCAMMLRYTFNQDEWAYRIEAAVKKVLADGCRTADIYEAGTRRLDTAAMGDAVLAAL
ncbi:MAG: 3-isopropylmalate dehydrogenase [Burkholderiales bacterium]